MANVGDFVGDMVGTAVGGVGNVVGDVVGSVGDIATDLTGPQGIAGLAQDVYNNTVNDPGAMMGIANVAGRVAGIPGLTAVAGPASIALGYMGQGERDKTLGINNPTALGRLARSLVPSIVQRPVFDLLGVTGDHSFDGYGTAEAEEEGVAGIDTSGNTAVGGSEFSMDDPDTDTDTSTSTDTGDMQDPDDIDYGYDEDDDWAEGGAVGFDTGGMAVGRFGAYMGDEDDAAELAQVSAEQENIRRFNEMEKNRQLQQEIRQDQFFKSQQELEPGERLFSQTASPETRTSSSRAVIPAGFLNRNIPVGIEILQNFSKQLTGIPAEVMKRHNFKQQAIRKNKQDSLKITYKIDNARDFMTNTLIDPKEVRASLRRSEQETIDNFARKFKKVQKSLGLGTTFTLSPENLNAVVNADFTMQPNYRNLSGNVRIPLSDDTTVNVGAQRNLVEGGQDFNTYEGGVNTKVGGGILGLNVRKNPRENYVGATFNMPLN